MARTSDVKTLEQENLNMTPLSGPVVMSGIQPLVVEQQKLEANTLAYLQEKVRHPFTLELHIEQRHVVAKLEEIFPGPAAAPIRNCIHDITKLMPVTDEVPEVLLLIKVTDQPITPSVVPENDEVAAVATFDMKNGIMRRCILGTQNGFEPLRDMKISGGLMILCQAISPLTDQLNRHKPYISGIDSSLFDNRTRDKLRKGDDPVDENFVPGQTAPMYTYPRLVMPNPGETYLEGAKKAFEMEHESTRVRHANAAEALAAAIAMGDMFDENEREKNQHDKIDVEARASQDQHQLHRQKVALEPHATAPHERPMTEQHEGRGPERGGLNESAGGAGYGEASNSGESVALGRHIAAAENEVTEGLGIAISEVGGPTRPGLFLTPEMEAVEDTGLQGLVSPFLPPEIAIENAQELEREISAYPIGTPIADIADLVTANDAEPYIDHPHPGVIDEVTGLPEAGPESTVSEAALKSGGADEMGAERRLEAAGDAGPELDANAVEADEGRNMQAGGPESAASSEAGGTRDEVNLGQAEVKTAEGGSGEARRMEPEVPEARVQETGNRELDTQERGESAPVENTRAETVAVEEDAPHGATAERPNRPLEERTPGADMTGQGLGPSPEERYARRQERYAEEQQRAMFGADEANRPSEFHELNEHIKEEAFDRAGEEQRAGLEPERTARAPETTREPAATASDIRGEAPAETREMRLESVLPERGDNAQLGIERSHAERERAQLDQRLGREQDSLRDQQMQRDAEAHRMHREQREQLGRRDEREQQDMRDLRHERSARNDEALRRDLEAAASANAQSMAHHSAAHDIVHHIMEHAGHRDEQSNTPPIIPAASDVHAHHQNYNDLFAASSAPPVTASMASGGKGLKAGIGGILAAMGLSTRRSPTVPTPTQAPASLPAQHQPTTKDRATVRQEIRAEKHREKKQEEAAAEQIEAQAQSQTAQPQGVAGSAPAAFPTLEE